MAPGAAVNFIVGGTDYVTNGGIASAGLYAVDNNLADIITLSYGGCETNNGASGTAFWNTLWEQAAAQGQTAFISSGDSNAAGCSSSSAATGSAYGVNALGSSAYNVAVGGSMFVDYGPNQYWTTGSTAPVSANYVFTTATSYIPEAPWNQGLLSTTYLNTLSTAAQSGLRHCRGRGRHQHLHRASFVAGWVGDHAGGPDVLLGDLYCGGFADYRAAPAGAGYFVYCGFGSCRDGLLRGELVLQHKYRIRDRRGRRHIGGDAGHGKRAGAD